MRLALLITLLLSSRSALAMPPAVAAIAAYFAVSTTVVYLVAATVILSTGVAVYGSAQARKAERQARNAAIAGMQDRMATKIASESPHRIIYGRAKVGADIVAMFTSGDRDQFRHLVCVHAAHECDAIEEIYVNNVAVGQLSGDGDSISGRYAPTPFREVAQEYHVGPTFELTDDPISGSIIAFSGTGANMAPITVTSVSGRTVTVAFTGQVTISYEYQVFRRFGALTGGGLPNTINTTVRVQKHLGGESATADAYLMSVVPDKWASTAILRGLCYTVITLDLNHPEFQGGIVPIHALIRGKKLYDPRTGLTAWSQNPALAVYDYLTGPLCGVPASDLPLAQFIAAANVCDDATVVPGGRYTINGTVTADEAQSSVLESMAQCMAGSIVSTTWDIYAGKYIAPVAALLQTDIVGSIQITPGASDAAIYNGVKGRFISDENGHVMTDFVPYQNAVYRAADDRDLYTNIDFPFTNTSQRVTNLARIFTEDQRNGFTIKAEFSLKAWPRKVGERITFTSEFFGQSAKVYRITDKSYSPTSAVQLTLKEDAPEIWDFADAVVLDSTPNSDLPDPWAIDALASLSCTSGEATLLRQADGTMVPRILATWPATTTQAVYTNGQIEIEWRAIGTDTWSKTTVSGSETQAYLSPITPGFFYVVRGRCVNPYLNTKSDWNVATYQVQVYEAFPTVYKWAATQPAAPSGTSSWAWATSTFDAAPATWSLTPPATPTIGPDVSLWSAYVRVSNIVNTGTTSFAWADSEVVAGGYAAAGAAGTATWTGVSGTGKPADNATSDVQLFSSTGIQLSGNAATKLSGAGWTEQVISTEGYTGGCYASAVVVTGTLVFGLNVDPNSNTSFDTIDHGLYADATGAIFRWLNGASAGQIGTWVSGDTLCISFDGSAFKFANNGTVLATVASTSTARYCFDSSFLDIGSKITNIRFGPMTDNSWPAIGGTGKPADNATVGAPAGTPVGSTLAQTVEANAAAGAAAGTKLNTPFTSSTPAAISYSGFAGSRLLGSRTVTTANGTGPFTYLWSVSGDPGITLSGATNTASMTFYGVGTAGQILYAEGRCTIIDASGRTAIGVVYIDAAFN